MNKKMKTFRQIKLISFKAINKYIIFKQDNIYFTICHILKYANFIVNKNSKTNYVIILLIK